MITSKKTCPAFLRNKFGSLPEGEKRALFEREGASLFKEYQQWYRDNFWGKNPSGVKLQLFKKWLTENGCFFITKKR